MATYVEIAQKDVKTGKTKRVYRYVNTTWDDEDYLIERVFKPLVDANIAPDDILDRFFIEGYFLEMDQLDELYELCRTELGLDPDLPPNDNAYDQPSVGYGGSPTKEAWRANGQRRLNKLTSL